MPRSFRLEWRANEDALWNPLSDPHFGTEHIVDGDAAVAVQAFARAVLDQQADINIGEQYRITVEEADDES